MKRVLVSLLAIIVFLTSCTQVADTRTSTKPETIAEAFLRASFGGDIDTCLSMLSDNVLFCQDPPGTRIEGKAELEASLRGETVWGHQYSLTSPFNADGDKVTCAAKVSGDDFRIIGMEHVNINYEFLIDDGKIYSILIIPSSEDWAM